MRCRAGPARRLQREADVGVDDRATGDDGEVVEERLPAVTEERRLDGDGLDGLPDGVDHERRENLALDVLRDDEEGLAALGNLLQQRQEVGQGRDLLAVQQHERVLVHGLLCIEVRDEVRRQVALVELDALGDHELGRQGRGFLDRHDAVGADAGERLADHFADLLVTRGHGRDLGDGRLALDRLRGGEQCLDDLVGRGVDADAECHRVRTRGDVLQTAPHDGLSQHGGGGGAVAGDVVGLGGDALDELRAEVLERVLELDFPGDADTVVGDGRAAEGLRQHYVAATRTQGHLDRVGKLVDSTLERPACDLVELNLLGHVFCLLLDLRVTRVNALRPGILWGLRGGSRMAYLETTASTSRADRIRYSWPAYLISVPPYLE